MTINLIKPSAEVVGWGAGINGNFTTIENEVNAGKSLLQAYGDGSDGDVTITVDTSLSRDMYYRNLTIQSPAVLSPSGLRIYATESVTIDSGATVRNNGQDAVDGGSGAFSFNLGGGGSGGGPGSPGSDISDAYGGNGATGSAAGGLATRPDADMGTIRAFTPAIVGYLFSNGTSGGGFNAQVSGGAGGGGGTGGGGGGAGAILIATPRLVLNGTIEAKGGNGSGTGGGGGGGTVILLYGTKTGSGSVSVAVGTGGAGGQAGTTIELTPS